jgi:hypothetical protein
MEEQTTSLPHSNSGRKLALIVGVNNTLVAPTLPTLDSAERDADTLSRVLLSSECGFVVLPPLIGNRANSYAIKLAINDMLLEANEQDVLLFYFSGHAHPVLTNGNVDQIFLITSDFNLDKARRSRDPSSLYLSMQWLWINLHEAELPDKILIVLDCCYAGNMGSAKSDPLMFDLRSLIEAYKSRQGITKNVLANHYRAILAATGFNQTAGETRDHGIMTKHFLDALYGDTDGACDASGHVTVLSLLNYLRASIRNGQVVQQYGADTGNFVLANHLRHSKQSQEERKNAQNRELQQRIDQLNIQVEQIADILTNSEKFTSNAANNSSFDGSPCQRATSSEIDQKKLEQFFGREIVQKQEEFLPGSSVEANIRAFCFLQKERPVYGALLCFGVNPRDWIKGTSVRCIYWRGNNRDNGWLDEQEFIGDIVNQYDSVVKFLQRNLRINRDIQKDTESDQSEIPFVVLRELVANALIHREYSNRTDGIHIDIFTDRIEISNPGHLIEGMTTDDLLQEGPGPLRNPLIARIFYLYGHVEKLGTGILRVQSSLQRLKLRPAVFEQIISKSLTRFKVTVYRPTSDRNSNESNIIKVFNSGDQQIIITAEKTYDVRGLPNPYLGLRAFTYDDRDRFAGRRQLIDAAVRKLATPGEQRTLMFVTGASGSGKSSFVLAGLIPALESHYRRRNLAIRHAIFRPSRHPLATLTDVLQQLNLSINNPIVNDKSLLPAGYNTTIDTDRTKSSEAEQYPSVSLRGTRDRVSLLVIDQFEELFIQSDREQREFFFNVLETLPSFPALQIHVICTLRADYLPELFEHKVLYDVAKQGIDLRAMSREDLREALQRPLQHAYPTGDKQFEEALIDRLTRDAAEDSTYLPLLQATLEDLWWRGSLTLSAYSNLTEAIRQRAERVYTYTDYDEAQTISRSTSDQATIMQLFLDLVEVSLDDNARRDVRRRRTATELERGDPIRRRLIDNLCNARLLSKSLERQGEVEVEVVDIIHETLITNWERLRKVIVIERSTLQQRVRLEQALQEWLIHGRDNAYLLNGLRLAEAQELDKRSDISLRNPDSQQLLRESLLVNEVERRRKVRRSRLTIAALGFLFAIVLSISVLAFRAQRLAEEQARVAEGQARVAQARLLAANALVQAQTSPDRAILLAYEAASLDNNSITNQVLQNLVDEGGQYITTLNNQKIPIIKAVFSSDISRVLTISEKGIVSLWSTAGQLLTTIPSDASPMTSAVFSPDGSRILTASNDGTARLWSTAGQLLTTIPSDASPMTSAVFSPDGSRILTASNGGTARLWSNNGELLASLSNDSRPVTSAVFSGDGRNIVTTAINQPIRIWKADTGQQLTMLGVGDDMVKSVTFSLDSSRILVVSSSGVLRQYFLNTEVLLKIAACQVDRELTQEEIAQFQVPTPLHFSTASRQCPPTLR